MLVTAQKPEAPAKYSRQRVASGPSLALQAWMTYNYLVASATLAGMTKLKGKTLFITGASRGIGKAIALRAARDGANLVVAAKTDQPHPKLPGTVHSAVEEIQAAGGRGLGCIVDIRFEDQVQKAVEQAIQTFGGIDIVVNNASAIFLADTLSTPMARYDLMQAVNVRGTFLVSKLCLPHLLSAANPHILNLAPPLNLEARWFAHHVAYSMAKFGMSLCTLGMAEEFRQRGVAVNSLWPRTVIATAAVQNLLGGDEVVRHSRKPEIVADAAYAILTRPSRECSGNFFIDDEVLASEGVTDLSPYAVTPGAELIPDFFL
jgi:citronellol/citronellal dehydrogenase